MKPRLLLCGFARPLKSITIAPQNNPGTSVRVNRQRRSRRSNGGDSVGKYFGDAWSLAKRTAIGLNEIRKLVNIETKICEVSGTGGMSQAGSILSISTMAQGTDYINNRVGNSIKLQRIEFRAGVYKDPAATATFARLIVFRDLDGYGTVPVPGDVLQTLGANTAPFSPKDYLNRNRFSILYDELLTVNSSGDSSTVVDFEMNHEGHILYLGTTATAASNGKGSLYYLVCSNEPVNTPSYFFYSRIYYTDD